MILCEINLSSLGKNKLKQLKEELWFRETTWWGKKSHFIDKAAPVKLVFGICRDCGKAFLLDYVPDKKMFKR